MVKTKSYKKVLTKNLSYLAILLILLGLGVFAVVFNRFYINSSAKLYNSGDPTQETGRSGGGVSVFCCSLKQRRLGYVCNNKGACVLPVPKIDLNQRTTCVIRRTSNGNWEYRNPKTGVTTIVNNEICTPSTYKPCRNNNLGYSGFRKCRAITDVSNLCNNVGYWPTDDDSCDADYPLDSVVASGFENYVCNTSDDCVKVTGRSIYDYCDINHKCVADSLVEQCYKKYTDKNLCNNGLIKYSIYEIKCKWNSVSNYCTSDGINKLPLIP